MRLFLASFTFRIPLDSILAMLIGWEAIGLTRGPPQITRMELSKFLP